MWHLLSPRMAVTRSAKSPLPSSFWAPLAPENSLDVCTASSGTGRTRSFKHSWRLVCAWDLSIRQVLLTELIPAGAPGQQTTWLPWLGADVSAHVGPALMNCLRAG